MLISPIEFKYFFVKNKQKFKFKSNTLIVYEQKIKYKVND